MSRVTFLLGGAGRAGTTWVHACLDEHPESFVPAVKEVHYFSFHFERGPEWYERHFAPASAEVAIGECSPSYLVVPEAAERIRAYIPEVRLVFTLRDPIQRAYTAYCARRAVGKVSADVDRAIVPGSEYVEHGMYHRHLSRYFEAFPADQILVLTQDDLREDPAAFLKRVFAHLKIDRDFRPSILGVRLNQRRTNKRFPLLHRAILRAVQFGQRRSSLVGRSLLQLRKAGLTSLYHRLNQGGGYPQLSGDAQRRLADYFRDDNERLSGLLGRDLSEWISRYSGLRDSRRSWHV